MIRNILKLLSITIAIMAFSGCDIWDTGDHPQVIAIQDIADFADSNDTKHAPDAKLYKAAGVSIDGADINATNGYIQTLSSKDVDTREEIQDIVDNIDTLTAAPNENPVAKISVNSSTVKAGEFIYMDAIESSDSDGEIVKYEWKEKNHHLASGLSYDANLSQGRHIITLIVTDDDNGTGKAYVSVIVDKLDTVVVKPNEAPTAIIDTSKDKDGNLILDAERSSDSDGKINKYLWKEDSKTLSQAKSYNTKVLKKGEHTITLEVIDDANATDTADIVITITDKSTTTDSNRTDSNTTESNTTK